MARPSVYNSKYHDAWAWSLRIRGATKQEIADAFEVDASTIDNWEKAHPSFRKSMEATAQGVNAQVEQTLFMRATGCEITEEKTHETVGADGKKTVTSRDKTKKKVAPDTAALIFWLSNRVGDRWKQRQQVEVTGDASGVDFSKLSANDLKEIAKLAKDGVGDADNDKRDDTDKP